VFLNDNNIYDISAIANNLGLNSGDHLNVGYNYLDLRTTSTDMSNIRTLQNRGVITEYEPSIVTGGLFWMGDTLDYGYYPDEKPIHEVFLSYDFYIG